MDSTVHASSDQLVLHRKATRIAFAYWWLIVTFVFAGLTGHDPWKADEAYVFGVVQHMLQSCDWVVPTLAGEPFMEKPPLFYWIAAIVARVLAPWLPIHDGARVASGILMLLNVWIVGATARLWWGKKFESCAMLTLVACLGMVVQSHSMMPDLSLLTGFALAALGFASVLRWPIRGGLLVGVGTGVGFLSKGLIAPGVIGMTALALPICFAQWRAQAYAKGLGLAALISLPFLTAWPVALYLRSPSLFREWFWENNIGRFVGFSVWRLRTRHTPWLWTRTIPWFTFPGLPLALLSLWRRRARMLSEAPIQYALAAFAVLMSTLAMSASAREVYAWPLLIPISLAAAPTAAALPPRAEQAWIGLSVVLFGTLSLAVLAIWAFMTVNGAPPHWPFLLRWMPGDFIPRFEWYRAVLAALLLAGAVLFLRETGAAPGRGLAVWTLGLALVWSLAMTLWTPWLDYKKSYRGLFTSMPMPTPHDCIASLNLGEGERAMLSYFTGRNPVRREVAPSATCSYLLVQWEVAKGPPWIDRDRWVEVWRGKRPGPVQERFWLFHQRTTGSASRR